MHFLMKSSRFLPSRLSCSAPNLQVSIFCSLVAAEAGAATSTAGRRLMIARLMSVIGRIGVAPFRVRVLRDILARFASIVSKLSQSGGDIAAVDGGDVGGGF